MQTLLSKALVASAVVAGVGLMAAPQAQAFALGGFGISGTVNLNPSTGPQSIGDFLTATFGDVFLDAQSGDFSGATFNAISNPINFEFTSNPFPGANLYTLDTALVINLSNVTGNPGIFTLTVNPIPDNYFRVASNLSSSLSNVLPLTAVDDLGNLYEGSFSLNDTGSDDGTFSASFTAVPEPLTMMGASAAIAFGAAFKRRNANKG